MQDSRRIGITGRGMGVAAMLAMAAGMTVVSANATTRAVDAARNLASAINTRSLPRFNGKGPRGKRVSMSVATARRTAAKKRRVKAHRARR